MAARSRRCHARAARGFHRYTSVGLAREGIPRRPERHRRRYFGQTGPGAVVARDSAEISDRTERNSRAGSRFSHGSTEFTPYRAPILGSWQLRFR